MFKGRPFVDFSSAWRESTIAAGVRWYRAKCNGVFHMGNHVAIPSNQIGNRCEDGAVIEVQQRGGWLAMSKETEGQQGYSSVARETLYALTFYLRRVVLTQRPANDSSRWWFLYDTALNASPNGLSFYME